jgi:hypothetical protein
MVGKYVKNTHLYRWKYVSPCDQQGAGQLSIPIDNIEKISAPIPAETLALVTQALASTRPRFVGL